MTLSLPRPCRYVDLSAASHAGQLPALALLADSPPDELAGAVRAWRDLVPGSRLTVFHTPALASAMHAPAVSGLDITSCEVASWDVLAANPRALACTAWASCAPYDAYGVLVKPLEEPVRGVLERHPGIYLAHDPAYGVIRCFDAAGLRDRLQGRQGRLRLYRRVCTVLNGFAWLASRISTAQPRWRRVR